MKSLSSSLAGVLWWRQPRRLTRPKTVVGCCRALRQPTIIINSPPFVPSPRDTTRGALDWAHALIAQTDLGLGARHGAPAIDGATVDEEAADNEAEADDGALVIKQETSGVQEEALITGEDTARADGAMGARGEVTVAPEEREVDIEMVEAAIRQIQPQTKRTAVGKEQILQQIAK